MNSIDKHLAVASIIAILLDRRFRFLKFRFGFSGILGFIPGIGDIIVTILAFYLVWVGKRMGVPKKVEHKMIANILFNFFIGLTPFVGDLGEIIFQVNMRNLSILKNYRKSLIVPENHLAPAY